MTKIRVQDATKELSANAGKMLEESFSNAFRHTEYTIQLDPEGTQYMEYLFPNAIQIFATSTPIQEEKYSDAFRRLNSDIEKYNSIARAELEPLGVLIDDLYPVIAAMPKEWYSDVTHFYTAPATERITNAVLDAITAELGFEPARYGAEYAAPETVHGF